MIWQYLSLLFNMTISDRPADDVRLHDMSENHRPRVSLLFPFPSWLYLVHVHISSLLLHISIYGISVNEDPQSLYRGGACSVFCTRHSHLSTKWVFKFFRSIFFPFLLNYCSNLHISCLVSFNASFSLWFFCSIIFSSLTLSNSLTNIFLSVRKLACISLYNCNYYWVKYTKTSTHFMTNCLIRVH